jgi:hypothetical protein
MNNTFGRFSAERPMGMLGPMAKMTMAATTDLQKKKDHRRRDDRVIEPRRNNAIAVDIDRILIG